MEAVMNVTTNGFDVAKSMLDMGNLNSHGKYVHLYLNGTYWGMFHLRERWNADMHASYLGGDKPD